MRLRATRRAYGEADPSASAPARLRRLSEAVPAELALSGRDGYVRYRELGQAADRVAAWLLTELGRGRHRVALCAAADHAALVAAFGVTRAGKICVPLDPSDPLDLLAARCADASVSLVLSDLEGALEAGLVGAPSVAISDCVQPAAHRGSVHDPRGGAASAIVYARARAERDQGPAPGPGIVTSDAHVLRWSGGLTRAEVVEAGTRCALEWRGSSPDGVERLMVLALAGACAVTAQTDQELLALLAAGHADAVWTDGPALRRLAGLAPGGPAPEVRGVALSGGPASSTDVAVARRWLGPDTTMASFYAPPETGVVATLTIGPGQEAPGTGSLPAGWCAPDIEVEIVDSGGCRVAADDPGHVVVWGSDLPGAYWGDPALTATRWLGGPGARRWCRTGDRGHWDANGRLVIEGPGPAAARDREVIDLASSAGTLVH